MGRAKGKRELGATGEALAKRIADGILKVQRRVADGLNARANGADRPVLVAVLFGVCLLLGGYCLWLVMGLFR